MALASQTDPDRADLEAARDGNKAAFEALLTRHQRWVRGVIFGVLGDRDRVEDVAQQAWQTAWSRVSELRDLGQWRSWLYRLARNVAIDAGRDVSRRRRLATAVRDDADATSAPTPDSQAMDRERRAVVFESIRALPAIYREPFVLRHLEGWSYRQIAEAMDMPAATVETRLVRARQMLRKALKGKV